MRPGLSPGDHGATLTLLGGTIPEWTLNIDFVPLAAITDHALVLPTIDRGDRASGIGEQGRQHRLPESTNFPRRS